MPRASKEDKEMLNERNMEDDNNQESNKYRNEVLNEYINHLDGDNNFNINDNELKEEKEEEEDEFDKAEATYKKSLSNQKETEPEQHQDIMHKHIDKLSIRSMNKKSQSLSPNKGIGSSDPGYLYYKENKAIHKKQLLCKNKSKALEPLHFNNYEYYNLYQHNYKCFSSEKNSNEGFESDSRSNKKTSPKSKGMLRNNQTNKLTKGNKVLQSLFDPQNPYSNIWPNNLLKMHYNSKLHVDRFANGVPKFSLQKLNKNSCFVSVRLSYALLYIV